MSSDTRESLALLLPLQNPGDRLAPVLREWTEALKSTGADYSILLVNDGCTDSTGSKLEELVTTFPQLKVLSHPTPKGFGACLRTALEVATEDLIVIASLDYPYTPADLKKCVENLSVSVDVYDTKKTVDAVSGVRSGYPIPGVWRVVGSMYRIFCRVVLGGTPERLPGWLGFRNHARAWRVWITMGVPLTDPACAFKLIRRSQLNKFPIQSDSEFALVEIFAKLTFLTTLVAEVKLTPQPILPTTPVWSDRSAVMRRPKFHTTLPDLTQTPPTTVLTPTA